LKVYDKGDDEDPRGSCRNLTLRECEDETHTPKMGTWESSGTLETSEFDCRGQNQSSIAKVKTPCIEVFFISLESYRSVYVENGLAWAFGHLQHMLWQKEGSGVKLAI
jgi:hypothetical protein